VLASPGQVDVRIAAKAANRQAAMGLIAPLEAEVRSLLGKAIFAADRESMEDVVGRLLREKNKTVAVYEDLTCGQLAERMQSASGEHFVAGFISSGRGSIRALLGQVREPASLDTAPEDPLALTDELAWSIRKQLGSDFGLALHAVADPHSKLENMGHGQTYVSLTDGEKFMQRTAPMAGRGQYDRSRMTVNALDLLRVALLEGMA
jgi:nicotinamide-nucleotide amidase